MQSEFCILCFAPADDLLVQIEENTRELLAQLQPRLDIDTRNNPKEACRNCLTKLRGYLKFRRSFLQTQDCVKALRLEHGSGLLDLRKVYLRNKSNGNEVSAKDVVLCRFCLKQTTGTYIALVEDQTELILVSIMMRKCFPGLVLGKMSGYVICIPCREALGASYDFITSLDVENRIKEDDEIEDMEFEDGLDLESDDDCFIVDRNDFDTVEAKVELFNSVCRNRDVCDGSEKVVEIKEEDVDVKEHKEEQAARESAAGKSLRTRRSAKGSPWYCELTPKKLSKIRLYKCDVCSHKARYKSHYKRHMLIHKNPSELTMYKCELCTFETRHKYNLTSHKITHKNPSSRSQRTTTVAHDTSPPTSS